MRVIHLSYRVPKPRFTDPEKWLRRIAFSVTVMEAMATWVEVHAVYHIDFRKSLVHNGVAYHFTGYRPWSLLLPFRFHRFIRQLAPDVIVVHGLISPWQVLLLRWQLGKRLHIFIEHHAERPFNDFRAYLQRWADRYVLAYFFGSVELGRLWVDKGQISEIAKVREITGTASVFQPFDRNEARQRLGIKEGFVFLWVGRLDENKDPRTVLDAFTNSRNATLVASLYMIFSHADGTIDASQLKDLYRSDARIHFVGEVPHEDLRYWYSSADVIVSSSHYEGSGIAVMEAMSCGCIPLLTDIPSFRTMSNEGSVGFLYPPGNVDELSARMGDVVLADLAIQRQRVLAWHDERLSSKATALRMLRVMER